MHLMLFYDIFTETFLAFSKFLKVENGKVKPCQTKLSGHNIYHSLLPQLILPTARPMKIAPISLGKPFESDSKG